MLLAQLVQQNDTFRGNISEDLIPLRNNALMMSLMIQEHYSTAVIRNSRSNTRSHMADTASTHATGPESTSFVVQVASAQYLRTNELNPLLRIGPGTVDAV